MTAATPREPFRILVTGSRYCNEQQAAVVSHWLDNAAETPRAAGRSIVVVHGQCPRGGVDLVAHRWAERQPDAEPEPHPADWQRYGKRAGMIRNGEMVDLEADACEAFPAPDSRGTWDCIRKAADAGIEVRIHPLAITEDRVTALF